MKSVITLRLIFLLLCAAGLSTAFAQERIRRVEVVPPKGSPSQSGAPENSPPNQNDELIGQDDVLRVDTALVTVPVSITDRNGRYIADLKREDLQVFEDNVEQDIAYFASADKPFTVVLMVDTSTSTWSKLGDIRNAAKLFVDQLRPDDNVMVTSFARGFTIECDVTNDRAKIRKGIERIGKGLSTHLYDAVEKLMQKHLIRIPGRKAVVLFTDGVDATSSHATYESTVHSAEELDASSTQFFMTHTIPLPTTVNRRRRHPTRAACRRFCERYLCLSPASLAAAAAARDRRGLNTIAANVICGTSPNEPVAGFTMRIRT